MSSDARAASLDIVFRLLIMFLGKVLLLVVAVLEATGVVDDG